MEAEIGERIALIRKKLSLTQQEFADKANVNRAYLGNIERGRKEASIGFISSICDTYGISTDWILTGEGHMYRPTQTKSQPAEDAQTPRLTKREKDMLMIFRELPEIEQNEILQISRKEKELADMRARLEKLERKAG